MSKRQHMPHADASDLLALAAELAPEDPDAADRFARIAERIMRASAKLPPIPGVRATRLTAIERRLLRLEHSFAALMAALAPEGVDEDDAPKLEAGEAA